MVGDRNQFPTSILNGYLRAYPLDQDVSTIKYVILWILDVLSSELSHNFRYGLAELHSLSGVEALRNPTYIPILKNSILLFSQLTIQYDYLKPDNITLSNSYSGVFVILHHRIMANQGGTLQGGMNTMKNTDKFLIGIVVGIVILVIVVFAVAYFKPKPDYLPEDTPEGVTNNYLFALRQEDYTRAYSYLSPMINGYPHSAEDFANDVQSNSWYFNSYQGDVSLAVASVSTSGSLSIVSVDEISFNQVVLFGNNYTDTFEVRLQRVNPTSSWKIVDADDYWAPCWNKKGGCN